MKLKYIHISWFSECMILFELAGWSDSFFYSGIHVLWNLVHLRKVTSKSNAPVFGERLALHLRIKPDKCQELINTEAFWKCCREEANSNSMLELFLWHAFAAFVIIIIQNGLPQKSCPSAWLLKCLCSEPCPPVDGKKEEINIYPAWSLPF